MGLIRSISGMIYVEVTSADPPGTMLAIQKAGLTAYDMEIAGQLQIKFRIYRQEMNRLEKILDKRGDSFQISRKEGLYWQLKGLLKRPILVLGLLALFALSLWVPDRIFFVRVEGNITVPEHQIIEKAKTSGITFGASRRDVRSEKMKNALLSMCPELKWAGVNTYGCVAVITVREREEPQLTPTVPYVSSIVAGRDGIITEITVLQGTAHCSPGQAVQAGQVMISGYTDCGIYIQAQQAKGEVYARTRRNLSCIFPTEQMYRQAETGSDRKISLILGKKRIFFEKDSGISSSTCAKIEKEYCLTLPGGFQLPVKLVISQTTEYTALSADAAVTDVFLDAYSRQYVTQQMIAGSIQAGTNVFTALPGLYRLDGVYDCCEMIGIERTEENLGNYG